MSNSIKSYETRIAGLSPDAIRNYIYDSYLPNWKGNVLDLGTGAGGWALRLVESKKFNSIDTMDIIDCREGDAKKLNFHLVDLAKDHFPSDDAQYDFIFATEVIEHIENPRHFVREIYRLLKPGGTFVMSTPSVDSLRGKISYLLRGFFPAFCSHDYNGSGHITPISTIDFHRICNEAGFKKIQDDFSLPGRMPSIKVDWQTFLPLLKGKNFSDCYISLVMK